MKNIFIFRHGQSEANANVKGLLSPKKEYVTDSSFGLTSEGKKQAYESGKKLAEKIKGEEYVIYISPYERTRQTAKSMQVALVNGGVLFKKRIEDPRLVEQDFGDFDFQYRDKWPEISPHSYKVNQARYNDPLGRFFARLENGENLLDVYNRVSLFVTTRLEREFAISDAKNHIIVTHGNTMRILKMFMLDMRVENFATMSLPTNASGFHIGFDESTNSYLDLGKI